jgi:hypothetical protein
MMCLKNGLTEGVYRVDSTIPFSGVLLEPPPVLAPKITTLKKSYYGSRAEEAKAPGKERIGGRGIVQIH